MLKMLTDNSISATDGEMFASWQDEGTRSLRRS